MDKGRADQSGRSKASNGGRTVWAAGGVLWRGRASAVEVGVVHRPRYGDWTLPKGKTDRGETLVDTAVREIAEETGFHVRLGRRLGTVSYDVSQGRKHVRYWSAESIGGEFEANHEVDRLAWMSVEGAAERLSYPLDRQVLDEFTRLPADLTTLLLVRHARAGKRSEYQGDDRLRPLDARGAKQSEALAPLLAAYGVTDLRAADRVRCRQTFGPGSARLGVPVIDEPFLSEESFSDDPDATQNRMLELAADGSIISVRAICSQGKVIEPLMAWWADRDGVEVPTARNRKASVWVLSLRDGHLLAADHIASPFAGHRR